MMKKWLNQTTSVTALQAQQAKAKKKLLTKAGKAGIILRKDVEGVISKYSLDKDVSARNEERIRRLGSALKQLVADNFPELPCPVIAGGSVRDMVFGLQPKDFDVFVDVSDVDPDEADDLCLLLAQAVWDNLSPDETKRDFPYFMPRRVEGEGDGEDYEGAGENFLIVYETYGYPALSPVQIIGVNTKPLDTIARFDYTLVKGFYDPVAEEFALADEFVEQLTEKIIYCEKKETHKRIWRWLNRNHSMRGRFEISCEELKELDKKAKNQYKTNKELLQNYYGKAYSIADLLVDGQI